MVFFKGGPMNKKIVTIVVFNAALLHASEVKKPEAKTSQPVTTVNIPRIQQTAPAMAAVSPMPVAAYNGAGAAFNTAPMASRASEFTAGPTANPMPIQQPMHNFTIPAPSMNQEPRQPFNMDSSKRSFFDHPNSDYGMSMRPNYFMDNRQPNVSYQAPEAAAPKPITVPELLNKVLSFTHQQHTDSQGNPYKFTYLASLLEKPAIRTCIKDKISKVYGAGAGQFTIWLLANEAFTKSTNQPQLSQKFYADIQHNSCNFLADNIINVVFDKENPPSLIQTLSNKTIPVDDSLLKSIIKTIPIGMHNVVLAKQPLVQSA